MFGFFGERREVRHLRACLRFAGGDGHSAPTSIDMGGIVGAFDRLQSGLRRFIDKFRVQIIHIGDRRLGSFCSPISGQHATGPSLQRIAFGVGFFADFCLL